MSGYAALTAHIQKIEDCKRRVRIARDLPATRVRAVKGMKVIPNYSHDLLTEAQAIIARQMFAEAEARERAAGEVARRCELRRLAIEFDQLRRELPALASAAAFDLLDTVREMRT